MNKRVFIIGAGFSKAIGDAPLVNEYVGPIYENARNDEFVDHPDWNSSKNAFLKIIQHLSSTIQHGLKFIEKDDTQIQNRSGIELIKSINIEHLCTLLDLNIERPFIPRGIGVDLQGCPIPFMNDMYVYDLENARKFIVHHIIKYLLPDSLNVKKELLSKFAKFIRPNDIIITFNYDLLLEQALWGEKLWSPTDGYLFGEIDDYLEVKPENLFPTKVHVIKLHGSLNWQKQGLFDNKVSICITHPFTHEPYFENLKFDFGERRNTRSRLLDSILITPTFMKSFKSKYELELIRLAIQKISKCSEIYAIGYSFPEADSLTCFLLTQIPKNISIKIIDLNARNIADKLAETYGIKRDNIVSEQCGIEDWIRRDFEYIDYKQYLQEQKEIREILL